MDGANGSTTFTDNSPSPKSITVNGNAQITTTNPKFGSGSATFDGTGDYLNTASDNAFNFSGIAFTIECWFKTSNLSQGNRSLFSQRILGANYAPFEIRINSTGFSWLIANSSVNFWDSTSSSISGLVSSNTWTHIALVGDGTNLTFYVAGTSRLTRSQPNWTSANRTIYIGSGGDGAFTGEIDDFRITKGVARYTSNFTPPTSAFPDTGPAEAIVQVASPLGPENLLSAVKVDALFSDNGPLGQPSILGQQSLLYAQAPSMLGNLQAVANQWAALASAPSMLGNANPLAWHLFARADVPSMLGAATPLAVHDFTGQLGDATTYYVMDLTTPSGTVRVPISSWQATLQTGLSNYVQCVVPAAQSYVTQINAATQFKILRQVTLPSGFVVEYQMASGPVQTVTLDQGPFRYTATIAGYSSGFAINETPDPAYNRTLQGLRSVSVSGGNVRVRSAIDWLLRPSQRVFAGDRNFVASYINYYVGNNDAYMEVGER